MTLVFLSELVGTFLLVFTIKGLAQVTGCAGGLSNVFVFGIIVSIGMSLRRLPVRLRRWRFMRRFRGMLTH